MMTQSPSIQDRAVGRWYYILQSCGVGSKFLSNRHGPCPICGGKDRFRFDNLEGRGTFFCTNCGAGNGIDLVMKVRGVRFAEAKLMVERALPDAAVEIPKAKRGTDVERLRSMWKLASPLTGSDQASKYLERRGLKFTAHPSQLRYLHRARYIHDDKSVTEHPAMVAQFVSPDAKRMTLHFTYLDDDGHKAKVPSVRKMAIGGIPEGGAVRLSQSDAVMGVAEGIETALSASRIFAMPVWATLSAGAMLKWMPPQRARTIYVFGDCDASFTGQHKAFGLAYRLKMQGFDVQVKIPDCPGDDWNDVLMSELV